MAQSISRQEILRRLRKTIGEKKPIIGAGCSVGIIAKCAEIGGADLIIVYSTGLSRIKGLPTSRVKKNSNKITLGMLGEIRNVVQDTPIIAGIEATELPPKYNLAELVKTFIDAGFSGVINFPTVGTFTDEADIRKRIQNQAPELIRDVERRIQEAKDKEARGLGYYREVEMMRICSSMDIFTMVYAFSPDQARAMAEAGVDCVVAHAGGTAGGLVGFVASPHEEAADKVQKILAAAEDVNPDIICMGHGGPFATPEDTRYLYEHTDAVGFVGASSIERIPVEVAIKEVLEKFKSITVA